jgi:electron transport complex protein RnfB
MVCFKACPYHAIDLSAKVPRIDSAKCVNCGICAAKCPLGIIASKGVNEKIVSIIAEKCNMCGICSQICPSSAIVGDDKTPYKVVTEKCIGCGICIGRCPREAIIEKMSE